MIVFQGCVERTGKRGVQYCCCQSEPDDEDTANGTDDGGGERSHTAEESTDAHDDFGGSGYYRDNVGNIHPFGHGFVGFQSILERSTEVLIGNGVIQIPDIHRIEPELPLSGGAVCDILFPATGAVLFVITCAIIPQGNMIEVFNAKSAGSYVGRLIEQRVGQGIVGESQSIPDTGVEIDIGGVGTEEVKAVGDRGVFVGTSSCDYDQANQGEYGHGHWREDTRKAPELAHVCDFVG